MIVLAPHYTQRTYRFQQWKTILRTKGGAHQWELSDGIHTLWFYDGPEVILCQVWDASVPPTVIDNGYSQDLNDADKAELLATYVPSANKAVVPKASGGQSRTVSEKTTLPRSTRISHDWADKTTWYSGSTRVVDKLLTRTGGALNELTGAVSGAVFSAGDSNLIDTYHGKITGEDYLLDASNNSYRIEVRVNGMVVPEVDPHTGSGSYTVDYVAGVLTFTVNVLATDEVRATYHKAGSSSYVIAPSAGKALMVDTVEVQFSTDLVMNDTVLFEVYGLVDAFAPHLVTGEILPSGTKIPLGNPFAYKTIQDFMNDAFRAYPSYPALGGPGWRGSHTPSVVFDWDYLAAIVLESSKGMEIRVRLEHETPFEGSVATATFYCLETDEVSS